MMRHRHGQPPPWSIHLLSWQLRLLSLLLLHYHAHSQPPPTNSKPHAPYPRLTATAEAVSPSHTMWNLARRLLLLSNDIHPLPGPSRHRTSEALSLNVGAPQLSKKRWNHLLHETAMAEPTLIAYQEVGLKSGYNRPGVNANPVCSQKENKRVYAIFSQF